MEVEVEVEVEVMIRIMPLNTGILQSKHLRHVDDDHGPREHGMRPRPMELPLLVDVGRYCEGQKGNDGHDGADEYVPVRCGVWY